MARWRPRRRVIESRWSVAPIVMPVEAPALPVVLCVVSTLRTIETRCAKALMKRVATAEKLAAAAEERSGCIAEGESRGVFGERVGERGGRR